MPKAATTVSRTSDVSSMLKATPGIRQELVINGSDLVCSLGSVLTGTWQLLLDHGNCFSQSEPGEGCHALGASIIRTVKRYVTLVHGETTILNPNEAIEATQDDPGNDRAVMRALEWVVLQSNDDAHVEAELTCV